MKESRKDPKFAAGCGTVALTILGFLVATGAFLLIGFEIIHPPR